MMQKPLEFRPTRSKYLVLTTDYILPTTIILAVIVSLYILLYSNFFQINRVVCHLDFEPCQNPVLLAELDKLNGQNIFKLNTAPIASKLTSGDYTIKDADFIKTLPNFLKVELHSVYPVVALKIKDLDTWIALDGQYRVIKELQTSPNVPTLIVSGPLSLALGKPVDDSVIKDALALTDRLFKQMPSIEVVTLVDENRIEILLDSGVLAILTPKKDESIQLRSLQAILQEVTISKGVHTIDVRFSQPVLR